MDEQGKEAWIAMAVAALILVILAAAVLVGCGGRIQGSTRPELFHSLPLGYEVGPMSGRWEGGGGWRLDCGEQVFNGFAPTRFWTCWPLTGYSKQPSQRFNATVVYDLAMSTDSSGVGEIQFVGYRTYYQDTLKDPLPDSLASVVFTVHARYRSVDSLWTGEVGEYDTLTGDFPRIYDVRSAWRCTVWVDGAKVYPVYSAARLTRLTAERPQAVREAGRGTGSALGGHNLLPRPAAPVRMGD